MSEQTSPMQQYTVSVNEPDEPRNTLIFTFVPNGTSQAHGPGGVPKRVPQFIAVVRPETDPLVIDWSETPDDPAAAKQEIESEIKARINDRANWICRIDSLVKQVEEWARELGWSTRRVEKTLDDTRIGEHRVPALLMQEETCRVLLEPLGRSAPGVEGVVDLYLMPAYDDIASLYYSKGQWNLHYMFPGTESAATISEAAALPLSKQVLGKVLAEMRQNAA